MNSLFSQSAFGRLSLWKKVLIIVGGVFALALVLTILKMFLFGFQMRGTGSFAQPGVSTDTSLSWKSNSLGIAQETMEADSVAMTAPGAPMPPSDGRGSVGGDAEEYERLAYNVTYKKRDHDSTCETIESWKPLDYIVFEHANKSDTWCRYNFKVARTQVDDVVEHLKGLEPTDFTADTATIKKQIVRNDSELNILLQKQQMLEIMLADAVTAYDEITKVATSLDDAESLTKIINSKLQMIERLTTERIRLSQQIDRVSRRAAELQDDIEYAQFAVYVQKYKFFDGTSIKDSWVREMQQFVRSVNEMFQQLTLGVVMLVVQLLVGFIYISIVGVVVFLFIKYAWRFVKHSWKGTNQHSYDEHIENT